jgi:hypothetical protein
VSSLGTTLKGFVGSNRGTVGSPFGAGFSLTTTIHTPGFPSAAHFVTQAFIGANLDNAALPGVYLAVVMGRHAGFLTAASAMARKFADDGPHLVSIYLSAPLCSSVARRERGFWRS